MLSKKLRWSKRKWDGPDATRPWVAWCTGPALPVSKRLAPPWLRKGAFTLYSVAMKGIYAPTAKDVQISLKPHTYRLYGFDPSLHPE